MKVVPFVGVLVLLLLMVGSASAYSPGLKFEKSASPTTYDHAGQIITYTYKVTNSGNVKISGPITVTDNKIGTFTISTKDLATGATVSGKATYKITSQNLKDGSVTNLAYATGIYNKQKVKSNQASSTVKTNQKPALTIIKSASPSIYSAVGQTITYTYKVTNSGNFKISGPITVTDNKIGTFTISTKDLAAGATVSGKATYKITSQNLKDGSVTNLAYATGIYNKQKVKSNQASSTVKTNQKPALTIIKSASPTIYSAVGQTITYAYKVTNSGNVKISGPITVTDNKIGTFTISTKDLATGATVSGKATYKITSQNLKDGSVTNLAYATGIYNKQKVTSNQASSTVNTNQKPALTIIKSASPTTYNYAGQTITYMYKVTNSGDVKISGPITVTDNKIGTFTISTKDLAPGAIINGKSTYKVTDPDLKKGSVTNIAYATGSVTNAYTTNLAPNGAYIAGCSQKNITSNEAKVTITSLQPTNIPEFPSIVLPVIAVVGIMLIFGRKR